MKEIAQGNENSNLGKIVKELQENGKQA